MPGEWGFRGALSEILKILNAADGENIWLDWYKVPFAFPKPAFCYYGDPRRTVDKHEIEIFFRFAQEHFAALLYFPGLAGSDDVALDQG